MVTGHTLTENVMDVAELFFVGPETGIAIRKFLKL